MKRTQGLVADHAATMTTDKDSLISSLRACAQVASLEIEGESPTWARVETNNAEDAASVEALLQRRYLPQLSGGGGTSRKGP